MKSTIQTELLRRQNSRGVMKKIYKKLGSDSVVVNAVNLVVLTKHGEEPASKYFPKFSMYEELIIIPIEPENKFKQYLSDYVIDWGRISEEVLSITTPWWGKSLVDLAREKELKNSRKYLGENKFLGVDS